MASRPFHQAILPVMRITSVRLGGLLAAVGGLLGAGGLMLTPSFDGELGDRLTAVADSAGFLAGSLADLFATTLVVIGALAIIRLLATGPRTEPSAAAARPLAMGAG